MNWTLVYILHKIHLSNESLIKLLKNLRRIKTWWNVYLGFFFGFGILSYFSGGSMSIWFSFCLISFMILIIITIYKDVKSGRHKHWWRKKYGRRYYVKNT